MSFSLKVKTWKGALLHTVVILALSFGGIYYFFNGYLPSYTRHGETIEVPNLENLTLEEAQQTLEKAKLRHKVAEKAYSEKHKLGHIIKQEPRAKSEVKENRTIYLTINEESAPKVLITEAILNELKSGIHALELALPRHHLKLGKATRVNGFKDYVYKVFVDGKEIQPGDKLERHTAIDYEVGNGRVSNSSATIKELIRQDSIQAVMDSIENAENPIINNSAE